MMSAAADMNDAQEPVNAMPGSMNASTGGAAATGASTVACAATVATDLDKWRVTGVHQIPATRFLAMTPDSSAHP